MDEQNKEKVDTSLNQSSTSVDQDLSKGVSEVKESPLSEGSAQQESTSHTDPTKEHSLATASDNATPVVYHTISGGPETLQDIKKNDSITQGIMSQDSVGTVTYTSPYSTSNAPVPAVVEQRESHILLYGLIIFMSIAGGGIGYLYMYMPNEYQSFIEASKLLISQGGIFLNNLKEQFLGSF